MVTIAIIALLAALLMAALTRAKAASRNTVCMSNLKQWGLTWTLYADDYNGKFTQNLSDQHTITSVELEATEIAPPLAEGRFKLALASPGF